MKIGEIYKIKDTVNVRYYGGHKSIGKVFQVDQDILNIITRNPNRFTLFDNRYSTNFQITDLELVKSVIEKEIKYEIW